MDQPLYPPVGVEAGRKRRELAPKPLEAFKAFSASVFADGALPGKTKQLIAVAVAHVTQCPDCIRGHTKSALKAGATEQEIMEAIYGLPPRCALAGPMRTRRWPSTSCSMRTTPPRADPNRHRG